MKQRFKELSKLAEAIREGVDGNMNKQLDSYIASSKNGIPIL